MTRARRFEIISRDATDGNRRRLATRMWRSHSCRLALTLAGLVLAMASGCSKKTPTATVPPQPVAQTPEQTAPQPGPAASALVQADGQPDLGELNRTLIRWIVRNRRQPANFSDFAASAGVAIPPAPAGKKYVLAKNMHIQLVPQ